MLEIIRQMSDIANRLYWNNNYEDAMKIVNFIHDFVGDRTFTDERIVGVAILTKEGNLFSLPPPNRHHNVPEMRLKESSDGFITSKNRFVDRYQGFVIAMANGQYLMDVDFPRTPGVLHSEDVW